MEQPYGWYWNPSSQHGTVKQAKESCKLIDHNGTGFLVGLPLWSFIFEKKYPFRTPSDRLLRQSFFLSFSGFLSFPFSGDIIIKNGGLVQSVVWFTAAVLDNGAFIYFVADCWLKACPISPDRWRENAEKCTPAEAVERCTLAKDICRPQRPLFCLLWAV